MAYHIHTLANGIKVVHIAAAGPVCYCGLIINAGSRDEHDDEYGLAHFIEHVIFKGTTKRKAHHILSRLDEVGGELNAYTTKEETTVHAAFLDRDFDRAAELIADMVFNSTFPERELTKEKSVIADEIASYRDTPSELIFDEFEELVFANPSLAHNILGTVDSLSRFDGDKVRAFMQRNYNTDQMVFSVLGNMSEAKAIRVAEKYFGHIAPNPRTSNRRPAGHYAQSTVRTAKETHQGHMVVGNLAPDCFDDHRLPVSLLSNYLGGPCMNARLSILLRERNGIAYNVESAYTPFTDTGLFTIYFGTDTDNIDRSLSIVRRELKRLCTTPFSASQMRKIKRQYAGQILMSTDNGESQMLSIGKSVLLYGDADPIETMCQRVEQTTAGQLLEAAQTVIDPDNLSTLIYC